MEIIGVCVGCVLCSFTALVFSLICMKQANAAADRAQASEEAVVRLLVDSRREFSASGKPLRVAGPHAGLTVAQPEGE